MIALPAGVPVVVVHEAVSFARGIDGMRGLCLAIVKQDPMERGYFIFISKQRNQVRILWYDAQGFLLCTKRLSSGRFKNWPKPDGTQFSMVEYFQAQGLLCDSNINEKNFHPVWKKMAN
jgi:transposase